MHRIFKRRIGSAVDPDFLLPTHPPADLTGLALSGGGIRSATFNFGLLQELHSHGWLRLFDYLSTVSGGGFIGGWWSAWMSRSVDHSAEGQLPAPARRNATDEAEMGGKFEFDPDKLHDPRRFLRRIIIEA